LVRCRLQFWLRLVAIMVAYLLLVELTKHWFDRREARRPESIARQKGRAKLRVEPSSK